MSKISAYPEKRHYETVVKALVEKHPGLKDPGSEKGWQSWFYSLKFKLGNYRKKLSAAGCHEVVVNKRKGVEAKGSRHKKSKGERRREIVGDQPLITELKSRWPALFSERQIQAEFQRIDWKEAGTKKHFGLRKMTQMRGGGLLLSWDYHTTCLVKIRQMSSGCVMLMETLSRKP
ncbi:Sterile alpha motif domain containing protein 3 [Dissostichus eleginoides]|uniref:Sterile alpha motif domain containing protein 3 n=1 Tax=Dissostichus eleginoides TaxID=100907 RepID=A0AAD9CN32_DISEL|nr:Sterile alpha motif domain containing protein 3 [Dissostichus eleginoides]